MVKNFWSYPPFALCPLCHRPRAPFRHALVISTEICYYQINIRFIIDMRALYFAWYAPILSRPRLMFSKHVCYNIFNRRHIMIYQMILLLSSWHDQRLTTKLNLKWSYIPDPVALVCITTTYFWVDQDKISNNQIWDQNSKPHPAALLTWQSESLKSAFNQGRSWQKNDEIDNWHAATVVSTVLLLLVSFKE